MRTFINVGREAAEDEENVDLPECTVSSGFCNSSLIETCLQNRATVEHTNGHDL